ncbi:MAG: hypothetical protein V1858_01815 [Candidatus Gottesmanbacteria bacterium]
MLINMGWLDYPKLFKISYLLFIVPTFLVILSAFMSAKEMHGTLGQGLKKVAAGSIVDTIIVAAFLALEKGNRGLLNDFQIRMFFAFAGAFGAFLLISGYLQIYKITKRMKLFTL